MIVRYYSTKIMTTLAKRFDDPLSDAETFRLNSSSEIIEIGNKPSSIEEIEGQYMGLMSFSRKALKTF